MKRLFFLLGVIATTTMSCVGTGYTTTTYPRRQPNIYSTYPAVYEVRRPNNTHIQQTQIQHTNVNTNVNTTNINNTNINNNNTTINNTTINNDNNTIINNNINNTLNKPTPGNVNPIGGGTRPTPTTPTSPVRDNTSQTRSPSTLNSEKINTNVTKPSTSTRTDIKVQKQNNTIQMQQRTKINQQSKTNNTLQKTNTNIKTKTTVTPKTKS